MYSVRENSKFKVFATYRHSAGRPAIWVAGLNTDHYTHSHLSCESINHCFSVTGLVFPNVSGNTDMQNLSYTSGHVNHNCYVLLKWFKDRSYTKEQIHI